MPIYEFFCEKCSYEFEELVPSMAERNAPVCPKCEGPTKRKLSVFSAHSGSDQGPCGESASDCQMGSQGGCSGGGCPFSQ